MTIPRVKSYIHCTEIWKTVRSRAKGKPLGTFRMFRNASGAFRIEHYGEDIFLIHPNNTIEVVFKDRPPQTISKIVPLYEANVATGCYRIDHAANIPRGPYGNPDRTHMTKVAPEYFPGIIFDLGTGECMNRKPDMQERVNHKMSQSWKADLKYFRLNIKAKARVGALDQYVTYINSNRSRSWSERIPSDAFNKLFADVLKSHEPTPEFLKEFTRLAIYDHYRQDNLPLVDRVDRLVTSLVDSRRRLLKQHYGVYSDDP